MTADYRLFRCAARSRVARVRLACHHARVIGSRGLFGACCAIVVAACSSSGDGGSPSAPPAASTPGDEASSPVAEAGAPDAPGDAAVDPRTSGCGKAAPFVGAVKKLSLTAKGKSREYHVSVPASYVATDAHALVFMLHGATDTDPASMKDWFPVEGNVPKAIGVYPQALPRTRADGSGDRVTRWDLDGDEDLAFFDAMLASLGDTLCVDRRNVFVSGFSSGGNFSHQLACLRQKHVGAVAPVAGPGPFVSACDGPVPMWMTHDVDDDALPVSGARSARDFWLRQNGCTGTWSADAPAQCQKAACPAASPVVYCESSGVGHDVPSYAAKAIGAFFVASRR
jgi:polyhydroxybutyrate depolymerase